MTDSRVDADQLLRKFDEKDDLDTLSETIDVVDAINPSPKAPKAKQLALREEKTRQLLVILNHIDAKLIEDFNFADTPLLSIAPPPETGLPAGVDPTAIRDPAARARYEKELAANQAKARQYDFQSSLRKAAQACTDAFEKYVSKHYPKRSVGELDGLIDATVQSKTRKLALKRLASEIFGHSH